VFIRYCTQTPDPAEDSGYLESEFIILSMSIQSGIYVLCRSRKSGPQQIGREVTSSSLPYDLQDSHEKQLGIIVSDWDAANTHVTCTNKQSHREITALSSAHRMGGSLRSATANFFSSDHRGQGILTGVLTISIVAVTDRVFAASRFPASAISLTYPIFVLTYGNRRNTVSTLEREHCWPSHNVEVDRLLDTNQLADWRQQMGISHIYLAVLEFFSSNEPRQISVLPF
jgi:hypothetical protein